MDGLLLKKYTNYIENKYLDGVINGLFLTDNSVILHIYKKESVFIEIFIKNSNNIYFHKEIKPASLKTLDIVKNAKIVEIKQRSTDRLFEFVLQKRKQSGKLINYRLIFELVGGNANTFLLNDENRIIFSFSDNNIDTDRDIQTGKTYTTFKLNKKYDLNSLPDIKKISFNELIGFYPKTAEFAEKIAIQQGTDNALKIINDYIKSEIVYIDEQGHIYPFPIRDNLKNTAISEVVPQTFTKIIKQSSIDNKIKNRLTKDLDKLNKILATLYKDQKDAEEYKKYYDEAELLKANYSLLKSSIGIIELTKYSDSGIDTVQYDISPSENIDKKISNLFNRARKLQRSIPKIADRIKELINQRNNITDNIFYIEEKLFTNEELEQLISKKKEQSLKKVRKGNSRIIKFQYKDIECWAGKNSFGNQELLTLHSSPEDLWFHAQGIPSSHILMKKNGTPEDEHIVFAARITAAYSRYKNENKVTVDYTLRKYVKFPKNSPIGYVTYDNFSSITVKPFSPEELENIKLI